LSARPGEALCVMVSSVCPSYLATVVRLGGSKPLAVEVPGTGSYPGREQAGAIGSYVIVPPNLRCAGLKELSIHLWLFSTLPQAGRIQGLVTSWTSVADGCWGLFLDGDGCLAFRVGSSNRVEQVRSPNPVRAKEWYQVAAIFSGKSKTMRLVQRPLRRWPGDDSRVDEVGLTDCDVIGDPSVPILIAAAESSQVDRSSPLITGHYDGKLESPSLFSIALDDGMLRELDDGTPGKGRASGRVASWDFSIAIDSSHVHDTSENLLHGTAVNMPMRAVTGHRWRGIDQNFKDAPGEYGAIHFHSDDLEDSGWQPDFELELPLDLPSGAYVIHLAADNGSSDDIPVFVTPGSGRRSPIAVLIPTFTYQAYANDHLWSRTDVATDLLWPAERAENPDPADLLVDGRRD
jgi:N,N-dimethylformamidase